jgi:hypothetical protein
MDLSCSIDSSRLGHNTGDFYNYSQKATEFGQSVVKKPKAATGAAFARFERNFGYQEPAPLSTVTARRFCDQQEMSSQVATGRSLP